MGKNNDVPLKLFLGKVHSISGYKSFDGMLCL